MTTEEEFSLTHLEKHFANCLKDEDISLEDYVLGYEQVYRFLNLLGTVFGWVAADVQSKIDVLKRHMEGTSREHYRTIHSMLTYETENGMILWKKSYDQSGGRHLLILHRALEYVVAFLERLDDIDELDKCTAISRHAYESTLMKYHPWVVQKAAKLAMNLLPTKRGIVLKVVPSGDQPEIEKAYQDFHRTVEWMRKTYTRSEIICNQFKLQTLNVQ